MFVLYTKKSSCNPSLTILHHGTEENINESIKKGKNVILLYNFLQLVDCGGKSLQKKQCMVNIAKWLTEIW